MLARSTLRSTRDRRPTERMHLYRLGNLVAGWAVPYSKPIRDGFDLGNFFRSRRLARRSR